MKYTKVVSGIFWFLFLFKASTVVSAQTDTPQIPSSAPEASQFDFWVGKWNLTWNDTLAGTNIITKELDGCVIHENFSSPTDNFSGRSYSEYNTVKGIWEQTWVDNQGNFMYFIGGFENGKMTLSRTFVGAKGTTVMQRMVFFNITTDNLDWSWESSLDSGKTWKKNWLIHYKRTKNED